MELDVIVQIAAQYGIFAALFISLLVYVIKNTDKREKLYQELLTTVHTKLLDESRTNNEKITDVSNNVDALDTKLICLNKKVEDVEKKVDTVNCKVDAVDKKFDMLSIRIEKD